MTCIADVAIAVKMAELAKRCGLKASNVDGTIHFVDEQIDPEGKGFYQVYFIDAAPQTQEESDKKDLFFGLLGMKIRDKLIGPELEDLEDKVDRALSLAPRARVLG